MSYPEIEAVVFDLDGTAVEGREDGMPSQELIETVKQSKGRLKIATASGRSVRLCRKIWDALDIDELCVASGGTKVVNPKTDEVVWEKHLPEENIPKIIEICRGYSVGELFVTGNTDLIIQELVGPYRSNLIVASGVSLEHSELMVAELIEAFPDLVVQSLPGWGGPADVHVSAAHKQHGVEKLIELWGLKKHQVAGAGDGTNDHGLFAAVGLKMAIGSGHPSLIAAADVVLDRFENEGLAKGLRMIGY